MRTVHESDDSETMSSLLFFFFFQAEDGIRDYKVTGVQTCALPISRTFAGLVRAWFSARFAYNKVPTIAVARDCWFGARRSWTRPFFLRAGPVVFHFH